MLQQHQLRVSRHAVYLTRKREGSQKYPLLSNAFLHSEVSHTLHAPLVELERGQHEAAKRLTQAFRRVSVISSFS